MRRKSPKVSGLVGEYSRFAETIGGDWFDHDCRPRPAVQFCELISVSIDQYAEAATGIHYYK
jgi:hypothetical protein